MTSEPDTGTEVIRVLLVDDQELIRTGLRGILRSRFGFEIVGELSSGEGVVEAAADLEPDVVVMDVRMPKVDGVTATRALSDTDGAPPVLVLTTFEDEEILAGALRAGAAGFLLKGVPADDLQRAVRTVAAGGSWLDPAVTGRVLSTYREGPTPMLPGSEVDVLTPREREVLALIGAGLSNTEIAEQLVLSEGTVKTHVGHIFTKLDLRDRAAAVVFAFDHGLVQPGRWRDSNRPINAGHSRRLRPSMRTPRLWIGPRAIPKDSRTDHRVAPVSIRRRARTSRSVLMRTTDARTTRGDTRRYYRCSARAHNPDIADAHPRDALVSERPIIVALDEWLDELFAPERATQTAQPVSRATKNAPRSTKRSGSAPSTTQKPTRSDPVASTVCRRGDSSAGATRFV